MGRCSTETFLYTAAFSMCVLKEMAVEDFRRELENLRVLMRKRRVPLYVIRYICLGFYTVFVLAVDYCTELNYNKGKSLQRRLSSKRGGGALDYIKLLFWALIAALLILLVQYIRRGVNSLRTVANAVQLSRNIEEANRERPRAVSGMTRLALPQIARDFPEFNYAEFGAGCENTLRSYFLAITEQDPGRLVGASDKLREQVKLRIDQNRQTGERERFVDVKIHQTEIARYIKEKGECRVILQSAVEYRYGVSERSPLERVQTKYNTELLYVQDAGQAGEHSLDRGYGVTCPNCGAPVTALGAKVCEYCGSAVREINRYAWSFDRIYECINQ